LRRGRGASAYVNEMKVRQRIRQEGPVRIVVEAATPVSR
jgi:hypothetical protein